MTEFVDFIQQGKVSKVKDELETQLQHKLNAKIELKKKDIAASMFTGSPQPMESEEVNESIPEVFNEANKMADIVKDILDDYGQSIYDKAVLYHMFHSIAILVVKVSFNI